MIRRLARRCIPLDADQLCAEAQRRTGLEDFGEPPIEPGLSILVNSLATEAELHPLGRFLIRVHLRGLLETRLRLIDAWKKNAEEIASVRIKRPVFIVGMPRSGSTYLHELLSENPGYRAPRVWEVMFPIGSRDEKDVEKRVRKAEFCLWCFRKLAPRADAVYPMRAMTPHESGSAELYIPIRGIHLHVSHSDVRSVFTQHRSDTGLPVRKTIPPIHAARDAR